MSYKLFLDDIRDVGAIYPTLSNCDFVIVRNYKDFINYIDRMGSPCFISFDNDLGLDENGKIALDGYAAAKWLVYESGIDIRKIEIRVHSANPVAKTQISSLLKNYIKYLNSR